MSKLYKVNVTVEVYEDSLGGACKKIEDKIEGEPYVHAKPCSGEPEIKLARDRGCNVTNIEATVVRRRI